MHFSLSGILRARAGGVRARETWHYIGRQPVYWAARFHCDSPCTVKRMYTPLCVLLPLVLTSVFVCGRRCRETMARSRVNRHFAENNHSSAIDVTVCVTLVTLMTFIVVAQVFCCR